MFDAVADPFPEDQRVRHPALSVGTIKKIQTMRRQGFKVAAIAEELNTSPETVRRYAKEGMKERGSKGGTNDVGRDRTDRENTASEGSPGPTALDGENRR